MIEREEISVVIPMYNSGKTIAEVLNAIINQTKKEYIKEIIVVNDGSVDDSQIVVKEYKKKTEMPIILINKENKGVSNTRNVGMAMATGNWIAFCDSDDIWSLDKIEKQVEVINKNESIDLLGGNHTDRELKILMKKVGPLYKASLKDLCIKTFPQTSTIVMKRKIYEEIGGFDEGQLYAEDGNYLMKIVAKYNYYYMQDTIVCYGNGKREYGISGLSQNLKKMYAGNVKNIRELKENKYISKKYYVFLRVFYWVKYLRRIVVTKIKSN